jgi:hypothetical protein
MNTAVSWAGLAISLLLVAAAVGAGVEVWLESQLPRDRSPKDGSLGIEQ